MLIFFKFKARNCRERVLFCIYPRKSETFLTCLVCCFVQTEKEVGRSYKNLRNNCFFSPSQHNLMLFCVAWNDFKNIVFDVFKEHMLWFLLISFFSFNLQLIKMFEIFVQMCHKILFLLFKRQWKDLFMLHTFNVCSFMAPKYICLLKEHKILQITNYL